MLTQSAQENVLRILVFDETNFQLVRNAVTTELFTPPFYRVIATKAIAYIDSYKQPPQEHIADELESQIKDDKLGATYKVILNSLYESRNQPLNTKYVIDQLTIFLQDKKWEETIIRAGNLYAQGSKDEAVALVKGTFTANLTLFDPGSRLSDITFLIDKDEFNLPFLTGIKELDNRRLGPARGQLSVFQAGYKKGKSWWGIHLGKVALVSGLKVCHITLELPLNQVKQRYYQSLFSISELKYNQYVDTTIFTRDGNGDITSIDWTKIERPTFEDDNAITNLQKRFKQLGPKIDSLIVKDYPSGTLSSNGLKSYLDSLERTENFLPDLLIIDYPSLMKLNSDSAQDYRISLGALYKDLRGIAGERNLAMVTVTQLNREGVKSKSSGSENVAEDISINATADTIFVYNQTDPEFNHGLARINVANSRVGESGFIVLITQQYKTGQFCIDSELISYDKYDPIIGNLREKDSESTEKKDKKK